MNCIIYAAKSTEDKHGSIPTQMDDCRAMATREGWEVVAERSDEGFSAYWGNRGPGLEQAKEIATTIAAEHGRAILVAQDADRFARGAGDEPGAADHLGEVYFAMKRRGVELWTVRSGHLDLLRAAIEGERSHSESARKRQSVKAGMVRAAQAGKATGGPRRYGYRYLGDANRRGVLIVVEDEAVIVRRIFEEFVAGQAMTAIVRGLQRDRIPTVKGGVWHQVTISTMLSNPLYTGKIEYGSEVYEGQHDAIISQDLFDRAQALRAARPGKGSGQPVKGSHLFRRGLLRCGLCGSAMVPRTDRGSEYYYCHGHSQLGNEHCRMRNLRRADVDTRVYEYFERVGLDLEATREQVASARDRRLAEVRVSLRDASREAQEAEAAYKRVQRDYQRGVLDAEDWAEQRPQLIEERDGARAELERLQAQAQDVESWSDVRDVEAEMLRRLTDIRKAIAGEVQDAAGIEAVRAALLRLFERFVVHVDVQTKQGRIEAVVKREAIATVEGETMTPVLHPTGLDLVTQNQSVGSATR